MSSQRDQNGIVCGHHTFIMQTHHQPVNPVEECGLGRPEEKMKEEKKKRFVSMARELELASLLRGALESSSSTGHLA